MVATALDRQNHPAIHVQENSAYAITKDVGKVEVTMNSYNS